MPFRSRQRRAPALRLVLTVVALLVLPGACAPGAAPSAPAGAPPGAAPSGSPAPAVSPAAAAQATATASGPARTVRIGIPSKAISWFAGRMAEEKGYYAEEHLDPQWIQSNSTAYMAGLLSGELAFITDTSAAA